MLSQRICVTVLTCLIPVWIWSLYPQFSVEEESQLDQSKQSRSIQPVAVVRLNPKIKPNQPNLNQGYLFNSGRFVKTTGTTVENVENNSETIEIETLQYDGSIIIGDIRKALISYVVNVPTGRHKPSQKLPRTRGKTISKIISVGDLVGGYSVSNVEPLFLTFTRGGRIIQRELFASEKQRKVVPGAKSRARTKPGKRTTVPKLSTKKSKRPTSQ